MKISVIIPAYNCETTIERCIDSVLQQKGAYCTEIIVIDDGSTDQTARCVQKMVKSFSNVFLFSKENGGVSSARNDGMKKASGDYIMFVDSDDVLKPGLLDALMTKAIGADLIVGGIELHQDRGISEIAISGNYSSQGAMECYGREIPGLLLNGPWCKLYQKERIDRYSIQFDPMRSLGEDTLFVFQYLSKCTSISFVHYCGYVYYQLGIASLMTKFRPESYFEARSVYSNLVQIAAETAGDKAEKNLKSVYSRVLLGYLRKTVRNRKKVSKATFTKILHEYIQDEIVQENAKNEPKSGVVQKITDMLTAHKCTQLLRLFLVLHVSVRGV